MTIFRNKTIKDEGFPEAMSMDDIEDGTIYGKVNKSYVDEEGNIVAKSILLVEVEGTLDDIENGADFGKVALTAISAGKIVLTGGGGVTGSLPVGNTDADVTADNAQAYNWLTGTKPPANADHTADIVSAMAYETVVEKAKLGTTILEGGYIKTGFVDASRIDTGVLVVGRTEAKCTVADADKTSTHTAYDITHAGGATGWQVTSGYIKSNNGYIELKGSDTPHIKAISSLNSNDFVQMTSASDTPRFDVYENESSTYHLRVRVAKDGISFRTGTNIEQGKLYGYYVDATTKGLYASVTHAFYSSKKIISEDSMHVLGGHNVIVQDATNARSIQLAHSGTALLTGNGFVASTDGAIKLQAANGHVIPYDNEITHLGSGSFEWADVWAADTTIQHSDLAEVERVHPTYVLSTVNIIKEIKLKYKILKAKQIKKMQPEEMIVGQCENSRHQRKLSKNERFQKRIKDIQNDTMNEDFDIKKKRASKIPLGSVVSISDKGCLPTKTKGQTNILGVVSTAPGLKLDSHSEGIFIAKVGKVPCRVVGKCKAGDLLQSSNTKGCAEKSENPKAGSIIGRAKETKNDTKERKIEVEVQLM